MFKRPDVAGAILSTPLSLPNTFTPKPECAPPTICHMSNVMCQMYGVRCQLPGVTCHICLVSSFVGQSGGAVINGATPSSFLYNFFLFMFLTIIKVK